MRASGGTRDPTLAPGHERGEPHHHRIPNVDEWPGVEIFLQEAISSGEFAGVYALDGHRLHRVGSFAYGGDSRLRRSITRTSERSGIPPASVASANC
jgi:hypothetical protein